MASGKAVDGRSQTPQYLFPRSRVYSDLSYMISVNLH
jgi:hypothetical protein